MKPFENREQDEAHHRPGDRMLSAVSPRSGRPLINDPVDGLPRPDDEGASAAPVAPATDTSVICTEGGPLVPYDPFTPTHDLGTSHVGLPGDTEVELVGFVLEGPRQGQRIYQAKDDDRRFVHLRPACLHYTETLTEPEDFERPPLEEGEAHPVSLLRSCLRMQMELTDEQLYACNVRSPRDLVSEQQLVARARRKKFESTLPAVPMFRSMTAEELAANADADPILATATPGSPDLAGSNGEEVPGVLLVCPPLTPVDALLRPTPKYVFFPDKVWQPPLAQFSERAYKDRHGVAKVWGASFADQHVLRFFRAPGQDLTELPAGFQANSFHATITAIAEALLAGETVVVVPYEASTQQAVIAAIHTSLDALLAARPDSSAPKKKATL